MHDVGLAAKPLVLGPAVSYMPWHDIDNNMPGLVDVWHYTSSTHKPRRSDGTLCPGVFINMQ